METSNINLVYISYTTKKIFKLIAELIGGKVKEYDVTRKTLDKDIISEKQDLLIVGMPVYADRITASSLSFLHKFKGKATSAIVVCIYGNRNYDDALIELKDVVETNDFKIVSAGAFVAQRTITSVLSEIKVKGSGPYKVPGKMPLKPTGNKKCNECGTYVKLCPTQAIPANTPRKTIKNKCITCSRCVAVCSQKVRHFGGILYKPVGKISRNTYSARKESDMTDVHISSAKSSPIKRFSG